MSPCSHVGCPYMSDPRWSVYTPDGASYPACDGHGGDIIPSSSLKPVAFTVDHLARLHDNLSEALAKCSSKLPSGDDYVKGKHAALTYAAGAVRRAIRELEGTRKSFTDP